MPQAPAKTMRISPMSKPSTRTHITQVTQALEPVGTVSSYDMISSPTPATTKTTFTTRLTSPQTQIVTSPAATMSGYQGVRFDTGLAAPMGVATSRGAATQVSQVTQVAESTVTSAIEGWHQAVPASVSRVTTCAYPLPGPARCSGNGSSGSNAVATGNPSGGSIIGYFIGVSEYLTGQPPEMVLEKLEDHMELNRASVIGSGSFGDVVLVRGKAQNQQLAIKVISLKQGHESKSNSRGEGLLDDLETRVRKEIQCLQDVADHPNLVRLRGVLSCTSNLSQASKEAPYVCIVMDYVADSRPLSQHIQTVYSLETMPEERSWVAPFAAQVMVQVARALSYMHQCGYVHRDVWSENMLINGVGHIVLVDLGSSERHDIPHAVRNKLNIPYMSPEAWQGLKQAPGDDCWALGLVLSEIVTGRFIHNRLGGVTSRPIHSNPHLLTELKQDTAKRGGPGLGKLCEELLTDHQSISMKDVVHAAGKLLGNVPGKASSQASTQSFSQSSLQSFSQTSSLAEHNQQPFQTMSETLSPTMMEIPVTELQKVAKPAGKQMVTSGAASPSAVASSVASTAPVITAVPGSSATTAIAAITALEGLSTSTSTTVGSSSPTMVGTPAASAQTTAKSFLKAGQRIKYLARSNNLWYPGVIVDRLPNLPGWSVSLDCVHHKEVHDKDGWRLQPE